METVQIGEQISSMSWTPEECKKAVEFEGESALVGLWYYPKVDEVALVARVAYRGIKVSVSIDDKWVHDHCPLSWKEKQVLFGDDEFERKIRAFLATQFSAEEKEACRIGWKQGDFNQRAKEYWNKSSS